jgi:uncharacterized membrane protein
MSIDTTAPERSLKWAGFLLGFALGGFFDGILLHQILQWHHLLSNVNAVQDMRMQIMADGVFHALMYVVAAVALAKLWAGRAAMAHGTAGKTLWATAAVGFGVWHIVDSVVSHWITGIHRIKIDSPNPLMWDLIWFFVFGVVPLILGWRVLRARGGGPGQRAASALALSAIVAGPLAALPAGDRTQVVVLFAPGVAQSDAFNALARLDARVLWVDQSGGMWAVRMDDPSAAWQLYRSGAMMVSNAGLVLGCFGWSRTG